MGVVQVHVKPPPTPLIKIKHDDKLDKYFVKLKLRRDPTSTKWDLYEFKMDLFDNGNPEGFLVHGNFNMNLAASGTPETAAKFHYIRMIFHG